MTEDVRREYQEFNSHYYGDKNAEGKRDGKGICTYADGSVYDGQWSNGKRHGKGRYVLKGTIDYTGQWKEDKKDGLG